MTYSSLAWVKSSYSGSQGGNCVETAANGDGQILVRDTQNRAGGALRFQAGSWRRFAEALKARA
ncbi:MAG TPA: DUF397 domain-containing protein [Trebonia sp.]|jgi:hypothetical protein|nr:DUF397 domain-containing protein [Trebonia sp.]